MNEKDNSPEPTPVDKSEAANANLIGGHAMRAWNFDELPVGRMGGRLASIPETYAVPNEEYFDEENFRGPKLD